MSQALLKREEVAEYLGVSPQSVYNWSKSGKLPAPIKIGRLARWRKSDIDNFIESNGTTPQNKSSRLSKSALKGFGADF